MKCKHNTLILISGALWFIIGMALLILGVRLMGGTILEPSLCQIPGKFSLTGLLSGWVDSQTNRVVILLVLALFIGHLKGKMILSKSVKRQITHIESLPNPAPLTSLYTKKYYLLIASMMGLGFLMRVLPITIDTRGVIDVAIGSALIQGALLFFRTFLHAAYLKKHKV